MAQDLRRTVGAMKMSLNLERTGDYAKNIAKRALVIAEADPMTPLTRSVERMGKLVVLRLKDALDAYTSEDLDRAHGASGTPTRRWTSTTTPCSASFSPT